MILTLLNLVISLAPSLVLVFAVALIAVRHQRLFLAMFMILTALGSTRDFVPELAITSSGISVYPEDLVTVVAGVAALVRLGHWRLRWATRAGVLVLALLVGLGVIDWIATYGIQLGTNSWRPQMLTVALLMYTTTRPRAWTWNDLRIIIVLPAFLAVIASVLGIVMYGLGSSSSVVAVGGVLEDSRPILASGSLLLLTGLWVSVFSPGTWTGRRFLVIGGLGSMILLTQNRSVWVATLLGLVAWWLAPRVSLRGVSAGLGGLSRTILVFFVMISTALVGLSLAEVSQSASNGGTWWWRVARWAASMNIPRSWSEWLVGSALGPTPASTPDLFLTSAHSVYVNAIEMTGLIGLLATVSLVIAVVRGHMPPSPEPLGIALCASFLSFGVSYQLPPWAWMTVGILLASAQAERHGGTRNASGSQVRGLPVPTAAKERTAHFGKTMTLG